MIGQMCFLVLCCEADDGVLDGGGGSSKNEGYYYLLLICPCATHDWTTKSKSVALQATHRTFTQPVYIYCNLHPVNNSVVVFFLFLFLSCICENVNISSNKSH